MFGELFSDVAQAKARGVEATASVWDLEEEDDDDEFL
jgi:hypothetical protein